MAVADFFFFFLTCRKLLIFLTLSQQTENEVASEVLVDVIPCEKSERLLWQQSLTKWLKSQHNCLFQITIRTVLSEMLLYKKASGSLTRLKAFGQWTVAVVKLYQVCRSFVWTTMRDSIWGGLVVNNSKGVCLWILKEHQSIFSKKTTRQIDPTTYYKYNKLLSKIFTFYLR